jgi:integrase
MSVYKRGNTYWYSFWFAGNYIQESAKTPSKTLAKEAERTRRRELEEGYNNVTTADKKQRVKLLKTAAEEYLEKYKARHSTKAGQYAEYCIRHLNEHLGNKMLIQITDQTVVDYQSARLREKAAGKTINEEIGELFRIMGDAGEFVRSKLKRDKKLKLTQREDVGKALSIEEERRVLVEAAFSPSPHIYTAVVIALNTGLRDAEIRTLTWRQIDFFNNILTVGKSKTAAGTGRTIPLNSDLLLALKAHKVWFEFELKTEAKSGLFVFPYGKKDDDFDPKRAVTTLKTAWQTVRENAKVPTTRFHDLRHTCITKLAESGASDETIMSIAGHVSRQMLSRYSHIRTQAKRVALESISSAKPLVPAEHIPATETTISASTTVH